MLMSKEIINSNNAPAPIGPYNQAVKANGMLFVSGQICIIPATGELAKGGVAEETHQVLKNLQAILTEAGTDFSKVVKTSIFLKNMSDFATVNAVYGEYFEVATAPARETVEVACLPKNVLVEISCIALV
jgi:2-iminobutanoate/2-iminopropanoate deaminase